MPKAKGNGRSCNPASHRAPKDRTRWKSRLKGPLPSYASIDSVRLRLLRWFAENGRSMPWRKSDASLYAQIISEILLQQTIAKRVANLFPDFLRRFHSWRSVNNATLRELEDALKPLGLWRRRAVALKSLARELATRRYEWPPSRKQLEQMPAVGQYVASAVLLFAYGLPEPLLDVNMARVLERYYRPRQLADLRDDPFLQRLARVLVMKQTIRVNWAILDLGAIVCTARKPDCPQCPLRRGCAYQRNRSFGFNAATEISGRDA
jgi:A/G-specific adenine glycosylase